MREIIINVSQNPPIKDTVYTQPEQQQVTVNPSRTQRETKSKTKTQQTLEDDQCLSTVLSGIKNENKLHHLVLQSQLKDISFLWNNFDSLKVVNGILCQSFEDSGTAPSHLQQFVLTLRPKSLESIHSSTKTAHPRVKKTLEKS